MKMRRRLRGGEAISNLLQECFCFAFSQLKNDKFRSVLTLLGTSVGIFSIVAVLSAVDALKESMRRGFETFGSNVVSISKWPLCGEDEYGNADDMAEYKWWEYMHRPAPTIKDYKFIKSNSQSAGAVAMAMRFAKTVGYKRNSVRDCEIHAVTYDWNKIADTGLHFGRYFTEEEINGGHPVGIIGYGICQELFGDKDPAGCKIKVGNRNITVIGVYGKQGESVVDIGGDTDLSVLIPLDVGRYMANPRWADVAIYAKPKEDVDEQAFRDELMLLMRTHRRLSPVMKNDFSINEMTFLRDIAASLLSMVNGAGWIIAGFSLLIGGFGVANIMFVSVKERTNIIGIQKALGAKKRVILTQFLAEALFLSITGGIIGVLLAAFVIYIIPDSAIFHMHITFHNILCAVAVSAAIGVSSGILPAIFAANLDPAVAISSK